MTDAIMRFAAPSSAAFMVDSDPDADHNLLPTIDMPFASNAIGMHGGSIPGLEDIGTVTPAAPVCARLLAMPAALAGQGFALRPETEADVPFLRRLYVSTRWEELTVLSDWSDAQKQAFLESQFALQRHHYLTYYASTDCAVLEKDGVPAGRLYVDRQANMLVVVDIALLPEWRGRGIGTALMEAVIAEARSAGKTVGMTVEKHNPAQRLYRRLGLREVADEGVHWFMEWRAAPDDPGA